MIVNPKPYGLTLREYIAVNYGENCAPLKRFLVRAYRAERRGVDVFTGTAERYHLPAGFRPSLARFERRRIC